MIERIRQRLTYSNVVATLALFVALGGSSYAAMRIGSADIADNSVRGKDIRNRTLTHRDVGRNALGGTNIRESRLSTVPRANALTARGRAGVRLRCPAGTKLAAGVCFETAVRPPRSYYSAVVSCSTSNAGNKRLPTHAELIAFFGAGNFGPDPAGELTANLAEERSGPEVMRVFIATTSGGGGVFARASEEHPFRCAVNPSN